MVKNLATLALRAIEVHRNMAPRLTRIQHGFMTQRNIEYIELSIRALQDMLRDMRDVVQHPPPPLK